MPRRSNQMLRVSVFVGLIALMASVFFGPGIARADGEFTLQNDSCCNMLTASISPVGQNSWTEVLKSQPLAPGAKIQIPFDNSQCVWDVTATFDDMTSGSLPGANLCQGAVAFHD